jgi:hypothetical protein
MTTRTVSGTQAMHQTSTNTWEPWMRAGDRALYSLHNSWGLTLRQFFERVQEAILASHVH